MYVHALTTLLTVNLQQSKSWIIITFPLHSKKTCIPNGSCKGIIIIIWYVSLEWSNLEADIHTRGCTSLFLSYFSGGCVIVCNYVFISSSIFTTVGSIEGGFHEKIRTLHFADRSMDADIVSSFASITQHCMVVTLIADNHKWFDVTIDGTSRGYRMYAQ